MGMKKLALMLCLFCTALLGLTVAGPRSYPKNPGGKAVVPAPLDQTVTKQMQTATFALG